MQQLTYTSSPYSPLNYARAKLHAAKHMLGMANKERNPVDQSIWMTEINHARTALRGLARSIRSGELAI